MSTNFHNTFLISFELSVNESLCRQLSQYIVHTDENTLMSKLENTNKGVWIVLSARYYERVVLQLLQSFITRFQNAHRFNFYTKVWNLGILSVVNASKMFWHLACTCPYLADSWLTAPRPWTFETATDNQTTWSLLSEDCLALFGFSCMF